MSAGISVVIPVFNGARYLGPAIESVLAQTVPASTIIVVDDGSDDETAGVVRQFGSKVEYVRQNHTGAAAARNAGQALVRTDVLAFMDADDLWCPRKLEWQLPLLINASEPAMVYGHAVQFISPDLSAEERALLRCDSEPVPGYCCSALLLHNHSFSVAGGFDPALRMGEFVEWFERARAARIKPLMVPDVVFHRRLHRKNTGRSQMHRRSDYAHALKAVLDLRRAKT